MTWETFGSRATAAPICSLGAETLSTGDSIHWTLGGLSGLTSTMGTYVLTLMAPGSGITDAAGNPLATDARDQWTENAIQFSDQGSLGLPGVAYGAAAWGDYDNDGHLDILLAGSGGAAIYHNDGNNTFHDIGAGLNGVSYSSVAWGDYDNDGRLDFLLCGLGNDGHTYQRPYHNDGNNTFHPLSDFLPYILYHSSVAWGDYNNDGRLDMLVSGGNTSQARHFHPR